MKEWQAAAIGAASGAVIFGVGVWLFIVAPMALVYGTVAIVGVCFVGIGVGIAVNVAGGE